MACRPPAVESVEAGQRVGGDTCSCLHSLRHWLVGPTGPVAVAEAAEKSADNPPPLSGVFRIYNPDGVRARHKYMQVQADAGAVFAGPPSSDAADAETLFVIEPYGVVRGKQTYLLSHTAGSRHPNTYVQISKDGYLKLCGPMDGAHRDDGNSHFVIEQYDQPIDGKAAYVLYNLDGSQAPNKYLHVKSGGQAMIYGPMNEWHYRNGERHFVLEPYEVEPAKPAARAPPTDAGPVGVAASAELWVQGASLLQEVALGERELSAQAEAARAVPPAGASRARWSFNISAMLPDQPPLGSRYSPAERLLVVASGNGCMQTKRSLVRYTRRNRSLVNASAARCARQG